MISPASNTCSIIATYRREMQREITGRAGHGTAPPGGSPVRSVRRDLTPTNCPDGGCAVHASAGAGASHAPVRHHRPRHPRHAGRGARAQPQRACPARRRGQEHGASHLHGAGRTRAADPHAIGRLPPRVALHRVRPPRRRAHRRPRPGPPAARRAAQLPGRDGADRGAGGRRRGLRRAGGGPTSPALQHELAPLPDPPLECRQGAGRLQPRHARPAPSGRAGPEHRLHDRRARGAGGRARPHPGACPFHRVAAHASSGRSG